MDDRQFDAFARTVSQARSRRQALRALAGAVAAGVLALSGEASAQDCKAEGKACKKDDQCCSGHCVGASGGSTAHSEGQCAAPPPVEVCSVGWDCRTDTRVTCGEFGDCFYVQDVEGGCACIPQSCGLPDGVGCQQHSDCEEVYGPGLGRCVSTASDCCAPGSGVNTFCAPVTCTPA
jgi:hypothetical protein